MLRASLCHGVSCAVSLLCSYVEKYDLGEPCDSVEQVLKRIAIKLGKTQRVKAITGIGGCNRHRHRHRLTCTHMEGHPHSMYTTITNTHTDTLTQSHRVIE